MHDAVGSQGALLQRRKLSLLAQALVVLAVVAAVASAVLILSGRGRDGADQQTSFDISSQSRAARRPFELTATQWAALKFEAVSERVFRSQLVTDGKIAVDEDHATPIFSPYAGRVTKLMAKPGDAVERRRTTSSPPSAR